MHNHSNITNGPTSAMTKAIMLSIYSVVFLVSEIGNGFVIYSLLWLMRKKKRRRVMDEFVLNLAATDFIFNTLSLFNCIEYIQDEWRFGKLACKLQGQFMEVTYTVSTLTLATISYSRYKAANAANPFKLLQNNPRARWKIALTWLTSYLFSLPLFYAYTIVLKDGYKQCTNRNFDDVTRQTYYLCQAIVLFVIPLAIMLVSQQKITKTLRWQCKIAAATVFEDRIPRETERNTISNLNCNTVIPEPQTPTRENNRRQKTFSTRTALVERRITKLLTRVWMVFTCCWLPFITYRSLDYFTHIRQKGSVWNQLWYLCQLSILLNSAINPFLYYRIMNRTLASHTKASVWKYCCFLCGGQRQVTTTSVIMTTPRPNPDIS